MLNVSGKDVMYFHDENGLNNIKKIYAKNEVGITILDYE